MNNLANGTMILNLPERNRKESLFANGIALAMAIIIVQLGILNTITDLFMPRVAVNMECELIPKTISNDAIVVNGLIYTGISTVTYDIMNMVITPTQTISEIPVEEEEVIVYDFENTGYTTSQLNVRQKPSTDSDVVHTLRWNEEVKYSIYDDEWCVISYNDTNCYIARKYITDNPSSYESIIQVSGDKRKSLESFRKITSRSSIQYKIQMSSTTADNGFRMYKGLYEIAIGTGYNAKAGTFVDVVLTDGTIINCIVGDIKANCDTNKSNTIGNDGSCVEFIVDMGKVAKDIKQSGDASDIDGWSSKVAELRFYAHTI